MELSLEKIRIIPMEREKEVKMLVSWERGEGGLEMFGLHRLKQALEGRWIGGGGDGLFWLACRLGW